MSFRRSPFQFSSTDPLERQRELEKRFGLSKNKMYVENMNNFPMGSGLRDSGGYSSPRLQHRVPIFVDGYDQPNRSSVDSCSETKKPNVRVIPIEVEGAETVPSTRHRTFSGPAGFAKECTEQSLPPRDDASPLKRSMQDLTKPTKMKTTAGPKVFNIPIKVEGADSVKNNSTKFPVQKVHPEVNGCDKSKHVKESKSTSEQTPELGEEQKMKININNAMKKIENILEEFKSYESAVKEFSGAAKDKQYRYLDEMLTRCMLRLDDIDTMGNENVRFARKNAVKQVQMCIDMLETKISSIKETEKNAENEVQNENISDEEGKLKESGVITDDQMPVVELSDHADKAEVKDVELMDVTKSETKDCNNSVNRTQVEPSQDATLSVSEIKAGDKLEDSKINSDVTTCKLSEVTDVEMVETTVNPESDESKLAESSKESVTSKEGTSCNLGEIETAKVLDDSKVMLSEVEMKEGMLEDNNSENVLEVEMPECPEEFQAKVEVPSASPKLTVEDSVAQERDVEMKEAEKTLSELKDKTTIAGNIELQSIPNKETENSGTDTSVTGLSETQTDCHKLQNITETVSSK